MVTALRWGGLASLVLVVIGSCLLGACRHGGAGALQALDLRVGVEVTSFAFGRSTAIVARANYRDRGLVDVSHEVQWHSDDDRVAVVQVDAAGALVVGVGVGATTIRAELSSGGLSAACVVAVRPVELEAIEVAPPVASIALGTMRQFTAIGTFSDDHTEDLSAQVAWTSDALWVAGIDGAGLATGAGIGTANVSASLDGVTGSATLTVTAAVLQSLAVTPAVPSIAAGTTRQFVATGTFSDSTTQDLSDAVIWSSSQTAVATISNTAGSEGLATSWIAGTTTISATEPASGLSDDVTLTVTAAVLQSLAVTPAAPSIAAGTAQQFAATGTFSDNTVQDLSDAVTWSSSQTGVATISNAPGSEGLASSTTTGVTVITATEPGSGSSDGVTLTVTAAVLQSLTVTPGSPSVAAGTTQQFTATGSYSDGSLQDLTDAVTWSSSQTGVAQVSNAPGSQGLATSLAVGSTTITATEPGSALGDGVTLTVTAAVLVSLAVTPVAPSIAAGTTQQFAVLGTYSDGSTQDLTTAVTWSSSQTGVATIANAPGGEGLATSVASGSSTITATHPGSGLVDSTTLTVTAAVLQSIAVTPANGFVVLGGGRQFVATGTYSDSSTQDLTTAVTWSSSQTGVATISNAPGSEGLATTLSVGSTTITATHAGSGTFGSTSLTVQANITFVAASSQGQPSGVTTVTVAAPSGVGAGDVLLAAVAVRPDSSTITPPAGWTLLQRSDASGGAANSVAVYFRVAGASEAGSYAWQLSVSTGCAVGIAAFRGVDTGSPVDVSAGQATASALTHAAPSVTTTVSGAMLFTAHGFSSASSWTPPTGMTEAFDLASLTPPQATGIALEGNYELLGAAGATGVRTATAASDADVGNGIAIALRPTQ